MGGASSKSSEYVRRQWVRDGNAPRCYRCAEEFSVRRRRHHCRCCGEVYCALCWGARVALPPTYGYPTAVLVCRACEQITSGAGRMLLQPRRIAMVRITKAEGWERKTWEPPLTMARRRNMSFEVFYIKLAHWRPCAPSTHLQFSVTLRTARAGASSERLERTNEYDANRPMPARIEKQLSERVLFNDDESPSTTYSHYKKGDRTKRRVQVVAPYSPSVSSSPRRDSVNSKEDGNVVEQVQMDVAWSLPIEAVLECVLDAHAEGDYMTLTTPQEIFLMQGCDVEASVACNIPDLITSTPLQGVTYSPNDALTQQLVVSVQELVRICGAMSDPATSRKIRDS